MPLEKVSDCIFRCQSLIIEQLTLALELRSEEIKKLSHQLREVLHERDALRRRITELSAEIMDLQERLQAACTGCTRWNISSVVGKDAHLRHWTGVPSRQHFDELLSWLDYPADKKVSVYQREWEKIGMTQNAPPIRGGRSLTAAEGLFLSLAKIRQGLSHQVLSSLFAVSVGHVSAVISFYVSRLYQIFKQRNIIHWLTDAESIAALPERSSHWAKEHTRVDLCDATYLFLEHSQDQKIQNMTWCTSKETNLLKFLVVCAPNRFCEFIAGPFLGRESDQAIFDSSNELHQHLQSIGGHPLLLVDKGFDGIGVPLNWKVLEPPHAHGGFTDDEVELAHQVASTRVGVECLFGHTSHWKFFFETQKTTLLFKHMARTAYVIFGMTNLYYKH